MKETINSKYIVSFNKVEKQYTRRDTSFNVLNGLNFNIEKGKITAILGSSGAGKTTTAKLINGLSLHSKGTITINGIILTDKNRSQIRKQTAFVFQNFNLFPHLTLLENIIYTPIKVYKQDKQQVLKKANTLLKQFYLYNKQNNYPHELSGGQKQRTAIIRALMLNPNILIMDEPTASLDPELTHDLIKTIKELNSTGLTIIVITHDIVVAKKATDNIIMLNKGRCIDSMSTKNFFDKKTKKHYYSQKFLENCD